MALPASIARQFAPNGGREGPFEYNGTYYAVTHTTVLGDAQLIIESTTDPSTTNFANDTVDTIGTSYTVYSIDAVQDSNEDIHVIIGTTNSGGDVYYYYYVYDVSAGSFSVTQETAYSITAGIPSTTAIFACLAVRSDGSIVAVVQDAVNTIHGTDYNRVSYLKRSTGGTWDISTTAIDDAGSVNYTKPRCVLGASDKVHIVYTSANINHKSLNSSDTLSSAETCNDFAILSGTKSELAYINSATNGELIMVVWQRNSNSYLVSSLIDDDATPSAETSVSIAAISSDDFAITGYDTDDEFYAIWVDSGDSDIMHDVYTDGSGWSGTPTDTESSITATVIAGANVYANDAASTVLAYLYNESTNGESYNEYTLSGGALTVNLTFISSSTSAYSQTATREELVSLGFISSGTSVYALSADSELLVSLTFISSSTSAYSLVAQSTIALGFIASGTSVYPISAISELGVSLTFIASGTNVYALSALREELINLGFISSSTSLYALSPQSTVALGFISSDTSVYVLTANIVLAVNLNFISGSSSLYALIAQSTIALGFISSSSAIYALTASREELVSLGFISSDTSVYALDASINIIVNLAFVSSDTSVYALSAISELGVSLTFIASGTNVYALLPQSTIALGFIASSTSIYALVASSDITINLTFISSGTGVYALQALREELINLGFISSSTSVYGLTASISLLLNLTFISSSTSLYALSPQSTIALGFILGATNIYPISANSEQGVTLGFIASTTTTYNLTAQSELSITLTFISSTGQIYSISVLIPVSDIIDYDGILSDYQLYQASLNDYQLYQASLNDYELYQQSLSDYLLYQSVISDYELYKSSLEDDMPVETGTIAKKLQLSIGADHTGSFSEPDTVSFILEYPNADSVEYIYGTDSEVTKHPTTAGLYYFKILSTQEGSAYVQAKAVWTSEVWTEITVIQTVKIYRYIKA